MKPIYAISCLVGYGVYRLVKYQLHLSEYNESHAKTLIKIEKIKTESEIAHREHLERMSRFKSSEPVIASETRRVNSESFSQIQDLPEPDNRHELDFKKLSSNSQ